MVIRAARAYALDGDLFRAAYLVDRYLAGIKPDDPRAPLAMGAMLLDLDRPYDALPYLIEKRKQLLASPEATEEYELKVLEVLASMVRGFARLGDRQQAMDAIQEMIPRAPKQTAIRVTLGDILFDLTSSSWPGTCTTRCSPPSRPTARRLIGIARVYLETFQPRGRQAGAGQLPAERGQPAAVPARLCVVPPDGRGVHGGQADLQDMLRRNENDHEVRYALGRVYDFTNEWEKAKAEFAKIPPQDKMARRARLWFGFTLLHQRKFAEAAQVAEQFMRDDPNNPEGVALYVRALAKMGQFDKAVQAGRGYLAPNPRDERSATVVRLAVGRALLEANRALDAAREFEIALSRPAGRVPEAYYGLARAAEKLGNPDRAQQIIATLCGTAGGDVRNRLLIADFYSLDFEDQKVIEIISSFPGYDENNLALLVRLADAQQRAARWSGNPADAFTHRPAGHPAVADQRPRPPGHGPVVRPDPELPQGGGPVRPAHRDRPGVHDPAAGAGPRPVTATTSSAPPARSTTWCSRRRRRSGCWARWPIRAQRDARLRQAFAPYLGGQMNGPGPAGRTGPAGRVVPGRGGPAGRPPADLRLRRDARLAGGVPPGAGREGVEGLPQLRGRARSTTRSTSSSRRTPRPCSTRARCTGPCG